MIGNFLGGDLGSTKTRIMIANSEGQVLGYAEAGPGNHEVVGFDGVKASMEQATNRALKAAGLRVDQIAGAGFGISGYDWPIEYEPHINLIRSLGFRNALEIVNDTELGLLAGSPRGWGVAVVSGTGCNCRGWDETRTRRGRVTGGGLYNGEFAGASELMFMTMRALAYEWTGRGPKSALSKVFATKYGVINLEELMQGINCQTITLDAEDARLVFHVAEQGDEVALDLVRWAGRELGELALTVIKQLGFQFLNFDLVQIGSMFDGSSLLTEEMKKRVHTIALGANFIRLQEPPVLGAVLLGMEIARFKQDTQVRENLSKSVSQSVTQLSEQE